MQTSNLIQLSPIAKVLSVSEDRQDKNDRTYRLLRLQGLSESEEVHAGIRIKVRTPGRKVSITQYEESYLNGEKEDFFDAQEGEHIAVGIFQATNLEPYEIEDTETGEVREVTSYTFPVIRGQNPVTVLKNAGHQFEGEEPMETEEKEEAPESFSVSQ